MAEFTVELADVSVAISALHESTRTYCADYITNADPVEHVAISQADLDVERECAVRQAIRDDKPIRPWSDRYLETLVLYRKIAATLLTHDTIVFHGSVVALDGRAYIFTAPSGTGKTTHTRFWLEQVPGSYVLNGDKPLLRVADGRVLACGTPWRGKEHMGVNESCPLAGICLLERGEVDSIRRIDLREALPVLISQTYQPEDSLALVHIVETVGRIGSIVPLWRMSATLDERSALVSYGAMTVL